MTTVNFNQVPTKASELYRAGYAKTWSEAMKAAWVIMKIKSGREVNFTFEKADGTMRKAVAVQIPNGIEIKGTGKARPTHIVTYFDKDKEAFRSFDVRRLVA